MQESTKLGEGVGFERVRRITGYLVGSMDNWNDAKKAEEHDRVKHSIKGGDKKWRLKRFGLESGAKLGMNLI